ncbi:MAG: hypothetical protein ACPG42_02055 [Alphaproteobacteria bacterium]
MRQRWILPVLLLVVGGLTACQPPRAMALNPLAPGVGVLELGRAIGPVELSQDAAESVVNLREDRSLSSHEVRWVVNNQTVHLARFAALDEPQPVHFAGNGIITLHPSPERQITGDWWLQGEQVCYGVEQGHVCSVLKIAQNTQQPFLYFARTSDVGAVTRPTAVVVARAYGPPR